ALHHHERWDGTGYPSGQRADDISIECRIISVADAFAALTAPRPHRAALSVEEALSALLALGGEQFDPALVWRFSGLVRAGGVPLIRQPRHTEFRDLGPQLSGLADRADDLSRGQLEALYAVALGLGPAQAAERCGRSLGTHRNWVSSLRRS